MYLSSWDEDHFDVMLATLNEMVIDGVRSVRLMAEQGLVMSEQLEGYDAEIYRLSAAFLTNTAYEIPDLTQFDPDGAHIIRRAVLAGQYIDDLPDI